MAELVENYVNRDTISRQHWKAGDTFQVYSEPTVEGMVAGTRWINEAFMIIFVVPAYTKKDGTKEKAAILLRTPAACSRIKLEAYTFPFSSDPKIKENILKANGSHILLQEVIPSLNQQPIFLPLTPASLEPSAEVPQYPVVSPSSVPHHPTEISDQISVQLALSQAKETPPKLPEHLHDDFVLDHLARELSRRLTFTRPTSTSSDHNSHPPEPLPIIPHSSSKNKVRTLRSSSSSTSRRTGSFSTSSTSRSSSASKSRKVRSHTRHHSSGFYSCPFSSSDSRQLTRPFKKIHTKSEERKYLRYALHDLYSQYTTLKNFVDSLRTTLVASPTKPYTSDLIWLDHHADYLDSVLLHMSTGPWTAWNEIITDKLTRAFLELVVRVSPKRKYPDLLEEPVRKWMKRKRVGVASQYGPVPSFLSHARVTDTGIEPKNGWDAWRPKESTSQYGTSGSGKNKPTSAASGEKSLEENLVKIDVDSWRKAQSFPPRLCMPRIQYHILILRMYHLGMIKFLCKDEVKIVNVHCVIKSNNKQRLIFDGRAVNSIFIEPPSVHLPSFSLIEAWCMSDGETAVLAKLDIDNYYHRLGVPLWMYKYLAMPPISSAELLTMDSTVSLPSNALLFPACVTLPMGLSHAVVLAQSAHLSFISSLPCAPQINTPVLPNASFWCFIYIDDVIIIAKHRDIQKAKEQINNLLKLFLLKYQCVGLVVNQEKVLWASSHGEALGCTINGIKGCVSPNFAKLCNVVQATKFLLNLQLVRHKWVEKILGSWVWFLLLRRPLFSILVNVYKFLHTVTTVACVSLWPSVRREFEMLIGLAELCVLDWRRSNHSLLCATDASLLGAGACTLGYPISPPLSQLQLSTIPSSPLAWHKLLNFQWHYLEHINIK